MGIKTTISILKFELHGWGNLFFIIALMIGLFFLFGEWSPGAAVLVAFAILVFLISLIRIDIGMGILIIGMLFSPEAEIGEMTQRSITIRTEDLLILALMMAWVVRKVMMGMPWQKTPLNIPIFVFLALCLISTASGVAFDYFLDPRMAAFYAGKLIEFFAIYFFAIHFIEEERYIHFLLFLFLLVGVVVSVYGLIQVGEVTRVTAPFEGDQPEPNTFGGYLMTLIAISLPIAHFTPDIKVRLGCLLVTVLAFMTLLFTLSRASFLGLIGMLFVLGIMLRNRWIWLLVVVFLMFHQFMLPEAVMDRVNYTFQSESGILVLMPYPISIFVPELRVDSSTFERIDVWRKVLYTWTYNPYHFLFGWGVTRNHILDSQFARFLVEIGLIGTAAFCWILWRILKCVWRLRRVSDDWLVQAFCVGYLACFVGVLIHSLGTITFYIVRIMEPFWFLTGIAMWWYIRSSLWDPNIATVREEWQPELPWRQVDAY